MLPASPGDSSGKGAQGAGLGQLHSSPRPLHVLGRDTSFLSSGDVMLTTGSAPTYTYMPPHPASRDSTFPPEGSTSSHIPVYNSPSGSDSHTGTGAQAGGGACGHACITACMDGSEGCCCGGGGGGRAVTGW